MLTQLGTSVVLNQGQQQALERLLEEVDAGRNASLIGAAGTGKTTLTGALIDRLMLRGKAVMCAAPTHKAAAVLRGKVPAAIEVCTVASLLGLRPSFRGRHVVFVPDYGAAKRKGKLTGVDVLIVDESSMISQTMATALVEVAESFGCRLVFVGDAAQLPPVDAEGEGESAMAREFLEPAGGAVELIEVVRHQGPILELATAIRGGAINEVWPRQGSSDNSSPGTKSEGLSSIHLHERQVGWLRSACRAIAHPGWEDNPDEARILCWTNRAVSSLTTSVRQQKYGSAAANGWQVGEIVANGDAIPQPGQSLTSPLAPASLEWRITAVEDCTLSELVEEIPWETPARHQERVLSIGAEASVQRLALVPLAGRSQPPLTVLCPKPGDSSWADQVAKVKRQIIAANLTSNQRRDAWKAWHGLKSHAADLRSAAVLSVHRSQGSSFRKVWLAGDLAWATGDLGRALHYTAVTRACDELHLLVRRSEDKAPSSDRPA